MKRDGTDRASDASCLKRNRILAALPPAELEELTAHVSLFEPPRGTICADTGEIADRVLFPCGAMISLVIVTQDGRKAEAGLIGSEGLIGGLSTTRPQPAFARAVVQIAGPVAMISLDAIERHKLRSSALRDIMGRYADCLTAQLLQTIACNALHSLDKRLARWLLTVGDITGGDALPLTQEYIAEMLGVQRTTVTLAAAKLQERGLIAYARGRIKIIDAEALQAASCGCNVAVREHYERQFERQAEAIPG